MCILKDIIVFVFYNNPFVYHFQLILKKKNGQNNRATIPRKPGENKKLLAPGGIFIRARSLKVV